MWCVWGVTVESVGGECECGVWGESVSVVCVGRV